MSWLSNIFNDPQRTSVVISLPKNLDHALETMVYLNGGAHTKDDIVVAALDDYVRKNLWGTFETNNGNTTEIKRLKQMKFSSK